MMSKVVTREPPLTYALQARHCDCCSGMRIPQHENGSTYIRCAVESQDVHSRSGRRVHAPTHFRLPAARKPDVGVKAETAKPPSL